MGLNQKQGEGNCDELRRVFVFKTTAVQYEHSEMNFKKFSYVTRCHMLLSISRARDQQTEMSCTRNCWGWHLARDDVIEFSFESA